MTISERYLMLREGLRDLQHEVESERSPSPEVLSFEVPVPRTPPLQTTEIFADQLEHRSSPVFRYSVLPNNRGSSSPSPTPPHTYRNFRNSPAPPSVYRSFEDSPPVRWAFPFTVGEAGPGLNDIQEEAESCDSVNMSRASRSQAGEPAPVSVGRAGSVAGGGGARELRDRDILVSPMPPIPPAINTAYGSPHSAMPKGLRKKHDLSSAISSALRTANMPAEDDDERREEAEDAEEGLGVGEADASLMEETPDSAAGLPTLGVDRDASPTPVPRGGRHGSSVISAPLRSSRFIRGARGPTSEPPSYDDLTASARSFNQESGLFGDAAVFTPRGSTGSSTNNRRTGSGNQQTPSRLPPLPEESMTRRPLGDDAVASAMAAAPRRRQARGAVATPGSAAGPARQRLRFCKCKTDDTPQAIALNPMCPKCGRMREVPLHKSSSPRSVERESAKPSRPTRLPRVVHEAEAGAEATGLLAKLDAVIKAPWGPRVCLAILLVVSLFLLPAVLGGANELHWYGWTDVRHNVGQFAPSWLSGAGIAPFTGEEGREYLAKLAKFEYDITYLKRERDLQKGAVAKLEFLLPDFVTAKRDSRGKIRVPQDFWHALKALIQQDDIVLTLEGGRYGDQNISQKHWAAVKRRLEIDGGAKAGSVSVTDVESLVETALPRVWTSWIKSNDKSTAALLDRVRENVDSAVASRLDKEALVTKEEFIQHLRAEFLELDTHVKAAMRDLETKMSVTTTELARLARSSSHGLTRKEVSALVDEAFGKAAARAQLESLAKGAIHGFYHAELSHQVNYLNPGSGAVVDLAHCSLPYASASPNANNNGGGVSAPRAVLGWLLSRSAELASSPLAPRGAAAPGSPASGSSSPDPAAALSPWRDEGDCWCTWPDGGASGPGPMGMATLSVLLARPVVPQHLVVEGIDPRRTLSPRAAPRDLELWVHVPDPDARLVLRGFSARAYPPTDGGRLGTHGREGASPELGEEWVLVARTKYEWSAAAGGSVVHKLPDELLTLRVASDRVLVRVTENAGDDHTCLYRVRLYGKTEDELSDGVKKGRGRA